MNSITLNYARQLVGNKIGGFLVKAVVKEGNDTLRLVCECATCGMNNKLTLALLQAEERTPGRVRCTNYQRHPVAPKAVAPNWKEMNTADFNRFVSLLSSEVYKTLFYGKDGQLFQSRVNEMPTRPKTREEAVANKAAATLREQRAAAAKIVQALYRACLQTNTRMPFENGIDGWNALDTKTQAEIVKHYSLDSNSWTVLS